MIGFIKALAVATLLQIAVVAGLLFWQADHQLEQTRAYVLLAEERANAHANTVVSDAYNPLQRERSADRADLEKWLDRRIETRLAQAGISSPNKP